MGLGRRRAHSARSGSARDAWLERDRLAAAAYATAVTLATGRNKSRLQIVWHYNSRIPPWVVAAQVGAARLIGDSAAGGRLVGEATDPAANLDGLELVSVTAQNTVADQPTATEIEGALNNGLTPQIGRAHV